ncbi:MAG TPA: methylated-DNA--[protein]-cysteine S-methyltransferase [Candidatus Limnocylindrales bacterium]|jgi:O-6-methylguanine DNA methyltransferase
MPDEGPIRNGGTVHIGRAVAPWGPVLVAVSARGLVAIAVLAAHDAFVADIVRRTGLDPGRGPSPMLDSAVDAVEAFLERRPSALTAFPIDLIVRSDWDRAVFGAVRAIPWGAASSYGRIARAIGRRGAARAVGGATGRNPIGLAIPCHRVVAGDGTIGGYGGDWFGTRDEMLAIKRELLALEGIELPVPHLRE